MLFDPDQLVYKAYETERSIWVSWDFDSIRRFFALLRAGRRWRGIQGDTTQLGGDFLVDPAGVIQYAYYSLHPADRPDIDEVLAFVRQIRA